ncbi:MAG: AtpZ/AtpI family protein [Polyangiales bacterium]|nr:AtpZ/AtpI family protein [Myxococcales bacterium]MCB9658559.1 AtpZ/AtpI family protein [Sandaracinaceae bacterium]
MFLGPEGRKQLKALGDVSTIGIEMAVSVIVGLVGGRWLDDTFATGRVFEIIGLLAGLAAAFRSLYRVARKVKQQLAVTDPGDDPTLSKPGSSKDSSESPATPPPTSRPSSPKRP